jgi:hypothetical protein
MKKFVAKGLAAFFITMIAVTGFAPAAGAQSELLFGQTHYYSVVFRGNGEAIVYAKMVIPNPGDTPLADLSFELPDAIPTEMAIYQMTVPAPCVRYAPLAPGLSTAPCMEYGAPDYGNPYYDSQPYYYGNANNQANYAKVDFANSGNLYKFTLPNPVAANQTTAVVVAYAARGYVKNSSGLFKFDFETLKVPSRVTSVSVAVDVDTDLILKGKKSTVNYAVSSAAGDTALGLSNTKADVASPQFNQAVNSIGYGGAIMKTAKDLAPNESFTVKGEYSASWWRLNLFGIILTILIIAAIILAIYFGGRFMKKKGKKSEVAASTPRKPFNGSITLTNVVAGLISAAAIFIIAYVVPAVASSLGISIPYDEAFSAITAVVYILAGVVAIFGPAIFLATKRGWRTFVAVLIYELCWLILFLIIYIVLFRTGIIPPRAYPVMY